MANILLNGANVEDEESDQEIEEPKILAGPQLRSEIEDLPEISLHAIVGTVGRSLANNQLWC